MERWAGRVAVVTGTSSGIGAQIAKDLVKKGLKVVGLARRVERVEKLAKSLESEKGKLHALKCDITKETQVKEAFQWVKKNLGRVDILVNNAGVLSFTNSIINGSTDEWRMMMDLNVMGLSMCTKEALHLMKENGVDDGHIVHINSVVGHMPPGDVLVFYFATKHAVTVLTEGLRRELIKEKSKIRVSSVSPGLVKSEMPTEQILKAMPSLDPEDISEAVMYVLGTPPHVQVHELTIRPVEVK